MLEFEELRLKLAGFEPALAELYQAQDIENLQKELAELQSQAEVDGFWNDLEASQKNLKRTREIQNRLDSFLALKGYFEETADMILMADEEGDLSLLPELQNNVQDIIGQLEEQRLATLLTGEYDSKNAILSFHAGAGGTEAQDWAQMLFRMYSRWGERHRFKVKTLDYLDGEEAGLKSAVLLVEGLNAYGYLKSETGVHRLVRISPFDSSGRRHTSFASLEVMPEIDDDIKIDIRPGDLKVDTFRSGGVGGQHVNTTDSAVRITHLPTGVVTACQNERSQHQNREVAMKMLMSKLIKIKEQEHLDRIEDIKGVQKEIAWGSQIRSYVFMPYTMAKDHRTNFEMGNIGAVMDGDIDGFINAYLKAASLGELL